MIISTDTSEGGDVIYEICKNIAENTDVDIRELPPLYETIDPDSLDALLQCSNSTDMHSEWLVEFSYCGYRVTVHSTDQVQLHLEPGSTASISST